MTRPLRWSDSRVERVHSLVLEKIDTLLRCSSKLEEEVTHEVLSKLKPHAEAALEELETLEWLRDLTDEELSRRQTFELLVAVVRHQEAERKPTRQRVLEALHLEAATFPQLQKRTGAGASTIRHHLYELINEGQVVAEGGYPRTYRLAFSMSKKPLRR
jgi:predicted Rossmann fold nucleotide-binding protein DprA/Smf involved in DNA uptake